MKIFTILKNDSFRLQCMMHAKNLIIKISDGMVFVCE